MADLLTAEQIAEFKQTFLVFDKDGDESIGVKELGTIMRTLGLNPTDAELQEMVNEVDDDGSGSIEFEEFLTMIANKIKDSGIDDEIKDAFRLFDRYGVGTLNIDDFRADMLKLGEVLTEEEVNELLTEADIKGDGKIKYQDFVNNMMSVVDAGGRQKPNTACSSETILTEVKSTSAMEFQPMANDSDQNVSESPMVTQSGPPNNKDTHDEDKRTEKNLKESGEVLFELKL